jgi:hypothetical protein
MLKIIYCSGLMCVWGVAYLDVESTDDLRRRLREVGYSDGAVKEILKWYNPGSSDRRA